jgi:hypothetical protein
MDNLQRTWEAEHGMIMVLITCTIFIRGMRQFKWLPYFSTPMEQNHIVNKYRTEAFYPVLNDSDDSVSWIR